MNHLINAKRLPLLRRLMLKSLLSGAQLRHGQLQKPRLGLHPLGLIAVSPPHPQPLPPTVVPTAQKLARLLRNRYLQDLTCQRLHKASHRRLWSRFRHGFAPKQGRNLLLHPYTRWYSLQSVDSSLAPLLRIFFGLLFHPGACQRHFVFTGRLAHDHPMQ